MDSTFICWQYSILFVHYLQRLKLLCKECCPFFLFLIVQIFLWQLTSGVLLLHNWLDNSYFQTFARSFILTLIFDAWKMSRILKIYVIFDLLKPLFCFVLFSYCITCVFNFVFVPEYVAFCSYSVWWFLLWVRFLLVVRFFDIISLLRPWLHSEGWDILLLFYKDCAHTQRIARSLYGGYFSSFTFVCIEEVLYDVWTASKTVL
jgi:hypothetical protein